MLGLWAALTLTERCTPPGWATVAARSLHAHTFAFFFLVMLLFAARGVEDSFASRFGAGGGYLLGAAVFLVYLIYGLGQILSRSRVLPPSPPHSHSAGAGCLRRAQAAGSWQDFLILARMVAVKRCRIPGDGHCRTGCGRSGRRLATFLPCFSA